MYQIERQNRCILQTLSTLHQSNNTRKTEEEILGVSLRSHHNLKQMKYFLQLQSDYFAASAKFCGKVSVPRLFVYYIDLTFGNQIFI